MISFLKSNNIIKITYIFLVLSRNINRRNTIPSFFISCSNSNIINYIETEIKRRNPKIVNELFILVSQKNDHHYIEHL